jgi:hypothetical protein
MVETRQISSFARHDRVMLLLTALVAALCVLVGPTTGIVVGTIFGLLRHAKNTTQGHAEVRVGLGVEVGGGGESVIDSLRVDDIERGGAEKSILDTIFGDPDSQPQPKLHHHHHHHHRHQQQQQQQQQQAPHQHQPHRLHRHDGGGERQRLITAGPPSSLEPALISASVSASASASASSAAPSPSQGGFPAAQGDGVGGAQEGEEAGDGSGFLEYSIIGNFTYIDAHHHHQRYVQTCMVGKEEKGREGGFVFL